jgi:hypothetical protein
MTDSGSKYGNYASIAHINFFKNMIKGVELEECPDNES